MKTLFTLLACFTLVTGTLSAQLPKPTTDIKGIITGIVIDNADKKPIEYANVAVYSLPDSVLVTGTITETTGKFEISGLSDGSYYIIVNYIGYNRVTIPSVKIDKENKRPDCGTISLKENNLEVGEVVVSAEKSELQYKVDKKVINVSKKLSAVGGTVANALENTPSVQVDAEGNVSIRGSQNFTVLIDGKPSALKGNDALKQIPASAVENVEVITNPSAKYDPDGTSGIVNIIMKKEYKTGTSGIINASAGTRNKYSGDFTLNYRTDKVNYFFGGNYGNRPMYPKSFNESRVTKNDTISYVLQSADRLQGMNSYAIKGGMDYYISQKTTLSVSGDYGYWGFFMNMDSKTHEYSLPVTSDIYFFNTSKMDIGGQYYNINATYDTEFAKKGHKLTATATFSDWNGHQDNNINIQESVFDFSTLNSIDFSKTLQNSHTTDYRAKLDYVYPISEKSKIEAGYQGRYELLLGEYNKFTYDNSITDWVENTESANNFEFYRNIQAAYANYSGEISKVQFQLGLRGEYSDRNLNQITTNTQYPVNRIDLFPTFHASYSITPQQSIQASYSKRVNRPQPWNLNPFPMYSDNYIVQTGNPLLLPEFTDSYELNYMRYLKMGFISAETYYKQTNNAYSQTLNYNSNDDKVYISTDNLDKNFSYGIELSGNLKPAAWVNIYASANLYSYNVSGNIVSENIKTQSLNSDFVLNTTFTLKQVNRLQLSGFYNAPKVTSQGLQSEMFGINFSASRDFFKRQLTVVLSARDIFQTMKYQFEATTPDLHTNFRFEMESPVIMLSLSYKINNYKQRKQDEGIQNNMGGGGIM